MQAKEETGLKRSLRQRHMTMISLGGVIGAGLFVGSGARSSSSCAWSRGTTRSSAAPIHHRARAY
jgi:amino acid permease